MENIDILQEKLIENVVNYGPKVVLAIITLLVGLRLIKWLRKQIRKGMVKSNIEASLTGFFDNLISGFLKVILIISVISMIGVQTTSFIAVLGAAGLAVGLALQGSLGNFAGGVLILLLKPFKVGHFIESQGQIGTVKEIQIFHSILITPDNKNIIVPNGPLANSIITNFSKEPTRRVDMVFGTSYSDDVQKTKTVLMSLLESDERILKDPEPTVKLSKLNDSSVDYNVRGWCNKEDYWNVFWDMHEKVKIEFDKQGISIPFPQRDVHLYEEKN